MLVELRIRNIAVIDAVTLTFAPALNVLTGETGAGKSLIVGALGLLLGDRAAGDRLRAGADRGFVEGVFEIGGRHEGNTNTRSHGLWALLDARGLEANDDTLVLKRELAASGRSRAWVNGTPVTAQVLTEVGARLVTMHGQHEAQHLLEGETQREVLDRFAAAEEGARLVAQCHMTLQQTRERMASLDSQRREVERRSDYLRFVVSEIRQAQLRPGEDEVLESEVRKLAHSEEIRSLALQGATALEGDEQGALAQLRDIRRVLGALSRIDPDVERWLSALDSAAYSLEELARDLSLYGESVDADPARLARAESRRDLVHTIKRKHGPSIAEVLETLARAESELSLVDNGAHDLAALQLSATGQERELATHAAALSRLREDGARRLSVAVSQLLPELGMPDGRFQVVLVAQPTIGAHGAEQVSFQVSLNAGTDMRPLSRIASGGELARVMLALSTVLAQLQDVPTLVFDEVDAGVGGTVAWQVGALMRRVAAHHQVLAISHLAQIAARAHNHITVQKAAIGGVTTADTAIVTNESRVVEIARMLGGDADREVSRAHARELLDRGALEVANLPLVAGAAATPGDASARRDARKSQRRGNPV